MSLKISFERLKASYTTVFAFLFATYPCISSAQEFITDDGYPCNVFLNQSGIEDAARNYAEFIVNPDISGQVSSFISGEIAEYLTGGYSGKNVSQLTKIKPLSFNLLSEKYGAKFGVDVCIPAISSTSNTPLNWTVTVKPAQYLIPPPDDWFTQSNPKISMSVLAYNCEGAAGSSLTEIGNTGTPIADCNLTSSNSGPLQLPSSSADPQFTFRLLANREAVMRFTLEEQPGLTPRLRRNNLDSGIVQIQFTAPPPPLTIDDLNKLLDFYPDPAYPECFPLLNFNNFVYFNLLKLQGPNDGTRLDWQGKDVDDLSSIAGNTFHSFQDPATIVYQPGTNNVISFNRQYIDNDAFLPSNGSINYDSNIDKVYRDSLDNVFVSATVSRSVGPDLHNGSSHIHQCRVWFKRSSSFKCQDLPNIPMPTNPITPLPGAAGTPTAPPVFSTLRAFCEYI